MQKLAITAFDKPVDLDKVDLCVDISSGRPGVTFFLDAFTSRGKHTLMIRNANRVLKPVAYILGHHVLILSEFAAYTFDLHHPEVGVSELAIHFLCKRAVKVDDGILVFHEIGCALLSNDLREVLWVLDDPSFLTVKVEGKMLRAYLGEHQSILIDVKTGFEIGMDGHDDGDPEAIAAAQEIDTSDMPNVIQLSAFQRR